MRVLLSGRAGTWLLSLISLAAVLVFTTVLTLAGESPVSIEGKLVVSGIDGTEPYGYYLQGDSDTRVELPVAGFVRTDISPLGDRVAYDVRTDAGPAWHTNTSDIWIADMDGSNQLDLTGPAAIGGINCRPDWSPDGSQIAFMRCDFDPSSGIPCSQGFAVWVINADGTEAHQASPSYPENPDYPNCEINCWAPNGYRLLATMWDPSGGVEEFVFTFDSDGTDVEVVPGIISACDWSPDGSQIASDRSEPGELDGDSGVWRQLVVADADGTGAVRVLYEKFISDAAARAAGSPGDTTEWAGPMYPKWSPDGERIAFLGVGRYTAPGPYFRRQVEVWIYDLETGDVTEITDDLGADHELSWKGDNTFFDDPEVTVDNTTVTFSDVRKAGTTTIIRDDDPPALPPDYEFAEEFYHISTTAEIDGPISICMTYNDEDLPAGYSEADLCIFHYTEDGRYWEDITVWRDPVNNIVCGESDSLSAFTLAGAPVKAGTQEDALGNDQ